MPLPLGVAARRRISPILIGVATIAALGLVVGGIAVVARGAGHDSAVGLSTPNPGSTAPTTEPPAAPVALPPTWAPPQPSVPSGQMQLEDMHRPSVFAAPEDVAGHVQAAGLSLGYAHTIRYHYHVHLAIGLMSGPVVVPGDLGIDLMAGTLSPVHTHDTSGIIHVEADTIEPFTLGQFFTEWGQPLGPNSIGHLQARPGYTIYWFVNGQRVADPASVVLQPHEVIVAYEDSSGVTPVPPQYEWPAGF